MRRESQLRAREPDFREKHVPLDYTPHVADSDDDYAEQDNYTVEKTVAQRPSASAAGGVEFKVRWTDYGPSLDTWDPSLPLCRGLTLLSWSMSAGT